MTSRFSSKTAFQALEVDSGEESEEGVLAPEPEKPLVPEPQKLSKTAQKKAVKAAREAKLLQQKQAKAAKAALSQQSSETDSVTASPLAESIEIISVDETNEAVGNFNDTPEPAVVKPIPDPAPQRPAVPAPEQRVATQPAAPPKIVNVEPEPIKPLPPPPKPVEQLAKKAIEQVQPETKPGAAQQLPPNEAEQVKKRQNVLTRTLWSLIMIVGFIALLLMGHAYMILLVLLCQTIVYREVTTLFSLRDAKPETVSTGSKSKKDPWSKTLNWYFFAVTNYFLYGESIIYYFKHVIFTDANLMPFATNHRIISFTLYVMGFMGFVMSLKKGYLKQQFGLFCWVHMSLLLIVVSSHFIVNNILEGLIWFWIPASLVICNDIFAYIWGITIGRTPLIKLSPKKTVEGFVGAFWSTIVFGIFWGTLFMQYKYMICPVQDLGVSAFQSMDCKPNPVFIWKEWKIWEPLARAISSAIGRSVTTIPYAPYQFHLLFLSCFASLVAPFGGFFASGFKRAFNIKDFGHSIPGHGGMTDRMDCQFLMGVYTYVYYSSIIREHHVTVGSILQMIVSGLTVDEQLAVIADLKRYLEGQGVKVPC